jgi:pimeloyl-ACP methyl ester carboxylesterase
MGGPAAWRRAACAALAAAVLTGCSTPAQRIDREAARYAFTRTVVRGTRFEHLVLRHGAAQSDRALHVYIEGDGSPYVDERSIARDPTPRTPVMLRLMALDPAPSVYVGRPCYFALQPVADCSPIYWTVARFSTEVVDSMAAVIEREHAGAPVVLLGHSGGGALAVLLAQRLPNVQAVVTVAGNLDTAAWTALHGYSPLDRSLNPADRALTGVPRVLHLAGEGDTVVPPDLITAAAAKIGGEVRIVAARHGCCWDAIWPAVLDGLP